MNVLIIIMSCYVIGSFPTAFILVNKIKGVDIRTVGSGNVGASNAGRILGKWGFVTVLIIDTLKGLLPVLILKFIYHENDFVLLGAACLIAGHSFSLYLNFEGGKGVATGLGTFIALAPIPTAIAAVVFGITLAISRMISLSSMVAAISIAVAMWFLSDWENLKYFSMIIAILIMLMHKENIGRIMDGTERKIGKKST